VRRRHFETLRPVCPVCRVGGGSEHLLRLAQVVREEGEHILEGALHCTNPACLREYPIIDGVPLIIANLRQYVADNVLSIYARRDLSDFLESVLGDCCGPNSTFGQLRQHLSSYAWDHYGDLDPKQSGEEPRPGSMLRTLEIGLKAAGVDGQPGSIIDVGCSVGRGTFALAEQTGGLVLGVDLHFPMLRLAAEALRQGMVRYPRRRAGLVYERREFPVRFGHTENVDFWACDVTALPFAAGSFSMAVGLNVLDCVQPPRELLVSIGQVLRAQGKLVLTCPYDWAASATPLEAWLGGHSQRSPMAGSCEAVLRALLTPGAHPGSVNTLRLLAERDNVPWHVRLHDRSVMSYRAHLVVAERVGNSTE
jgi:SAM-dependent methyltransferase